MLFKRKESDERGWTRAWNLRKTTHQLGRNDERAMNAIRGDMNATHKRRTSDECTMNSHFKRGEYDERAMSACLKPKENNTSAWEKWWTRSECHTGWHNDRPEVMMSVVAFVVLCDHWLYNPPTVCAWCIPSAALASVCMCNTTKLISEMFWICWVLCFVFHVRILHECC